MGVLHGPKGLLERAEPREPIPLAPHLKARAREQLDERVQHVGLVLDDEHMLRHRCTPSGITQRNGRPDPLAFG